MPGGDARQASGRGNAMFSGRGVAQQFDTLAGVAGHADVARRRHRRPGVHRHQRFRRGVRARAARHVGVLPARLQQHATRPRTAASAASRSASSATASRSRRAAATTPTAISPTRAAAIARRSCRSRCSPRCRRPICRCWSPPAGSGWRPTSTTCRSRSPSRAPRCRSPTRRTRCRSTCSAWCATSRAGPVGRFRETLQLPPGTGKTLAGKQVLYQSGVTLPPGRFSVKVVVRENTTGLMGTFEAPITVPELKQAPMKVSSVVLSTQLEPAAEGQDRQSARPRRRPAGPQPDARRRARPEAVLLLRGLRPVGGCRLDRRSSARAWRSTAAR